MPDRDYYLKDEPVYAALREKYAAHIERLLKLAGDMTRAASGAKASSTSRPRSPARTGRAPSAASAT